jgi:hypothetical protein
MDYLLISKETRQMTFQQVFYNRLLYQPFLLHPNVAFFNLLKNPVTGILIFKEKIDLQRIPAVVKYCFVQNDLPLVVKQSVLRTTCLMDFNNH